MESILILGPSGYIRISKQIVDTESFSANNLKFFPNDPSDTHKNGMNGRLAKRTFCPNIIMKAQVNHIVPINTDPHYYRHLRLDRMMSCRIH
jgi:hypothetical protein